MPRRLSVHHDFNLDKVLNGTQDFRWRPWKDGWHSGVLCRNLVHIRQNGNDLEYRANSDLDDLLTSYFRLDVNLQTIYDDIASRDDKVARLVKEYPHLRVLRQPDPWECTVSYICSANSNIQKITKAVESIAKKLGAPVELDGDERHTFPTVAKVLEAGMKPLEELNLGLQRHTKILSAAERIRDGSLDLQYLAQPGVCYAEAKRRLMGCYGIGAKVADCIALFALDKMEAFPVDVWVERAMATYFPSQKQPTDENLVMCAQDRFGKYAGYANQLLFHHQRSQDNPR